MSVQANQIGAEVLVTGGGVAHVNQIGIELLTAVIPSAAYNVFSVTTMPTSPSASSIQVSLNSQTQTTDSSYTGQVLTGAYETTFTEIVIFLPDLQDPAEQAAWVAWLVSTVKAQAVFQLPSIIEDLIPSNYSTTWWRLQPGPQKISWTVGSIIEALTFTVRSLSLGDVAYL